ncbi:MAG: hypothetical protein Q9198_008868, partial [Flavoplaca austrocitrina]
STSSSSPPAPPSAGLATPPKTTTGTSSSSPLGTISHSASILSLARNPTTITESKDMERPSVGCWILEKFQPAQRPRLA